MANRALFTPTSVLLTDPRPLVLTRTCDFTNGFDMEADGPEPAAVWTSKTAPAYNSTSPRWLPFHTEGFSQVTEERWFEYLSNLSTREAICCWMTQKPRPFKPKPDNPDRIGRTLNLVRTPAEALFMVIFLDTMSFLSSVQTTLDQIVMASVHGDALRIKSVVSAWRKSLTETQLRLAPLHESISGLTELFGAEKTSQEVKQLSVQILTKVTETNNKVERAQSTIRQELSILESQQQLEEAANVTKLTELAFIFVPLSFVASAFSMQIRELDKPVPLSLVVAAGVVALGLAYATRLVIRSSITVNSVRVFQGAMREIANVPEDSPTPTRAFLQGILFLLPYVSVLVITIPTLCMVMVVSLWVTRTSLDTSFKSLITALTLVMTVGTVTIVPVGRYSRIIGWMEIIARKDWLAEALVPGASRHALGASLSPHMPERD